jgi:FixJ family two-component response regulator
MVCDMSSSPNIYIAVIDDDESFCRSLGRLLRAAGYHAITYSSAEAFLADTKHPRFGCLLIDVELGGISGVELSRRLAAVGSTTPRIYITAHDDAKTRSDARGTDCFAFVSKVESGDVLLNTVADALHANGGESRSFS